METLLLLMIVQGMMGAFDVIYHHELTERLPWRKTAARELKLHGVRNLFYMGIYLSFGWMAWQGAWAYVLAAVLVAEVLLTLWDFVEEDRSRTLPASERVSHTLLALNYGAILACFVPIWQDWAARPTGFAPLDHGWLGWVMTLFAGGVLVWGIRDYARGRSLAKAKADGWDVPPELAVPHQRILVAGGTGFIGAPLCQLLIDQGHEVTIITRSLARAAEKFRGKVTLVEHADRLHDSTVFDVVINLTGEPVAQRWSAKARARIAASRPDSIHTLQRYLARCEVRPRCFIQASAIGMYGLSDDASFTESYVRPSHPASYCEEICFAVEDAAAPIADMGIRLCFLRIGLVLEKEGGILAQLLFPHEFGLAGPVGHGRQWMSWIHRDDVIGLIYHSIDQAQLAGAINAVAPEPIRQRGFAHALGKALHRPAFMPMPRCVVLALFGDMGREILLSGQHVLPEKALQTGYHFRYPSLDGALRSIVG